MESRANNTSILSEKSQSKERCQKIKYNPPSTAQLSEGSNSNSPLNFGNITVKLTLKIVLILSILAWLTLQGLLLFTPKPPLLEGISFSKAVFDENHRLLRLTLSKDEKYRLYTPLSQISPRFIETTLLQEDRYFRWHPGVNPVAFLRALWETYFLQSRRMGASTITMQLARLRFGIQSKKPMGKIQQIFKALQLEKHYSKAQILEAYLNLAPYGKNIEGVGAAGFIYFNQAAKNLNLMQAIRLTLIPQNPNKRASFNASNLVKLKVHLLTDWIKNHPGEHYKTLINLPLPTATPQKLPFFAPHLVNHLLNKLPGNQKELTTTIDLALTKSFERKLKQYLLRTKAFGVNNAAILLVDTRDLSVKVSIGSADFYNPSIQGQINGTAIKRSPGSTLKPFIYALAFDQGLIHPHTVLKDVPHRFGAYNPENFDKDFMGPIKAKDALILSRNIPAIWLAAKLKKPTLFQLLEATEVSQLKPESYYGLSLSLGGAELTLQELTSLYAMLANDGLWKPLRFTEEAPLAPGKRLLSPEASFLTRDILEQTAKPPSFESYKIPVAFKTGTSSGFRDALTLGIAGPYVLAVWLGNFNNQANPAFVGKTLAAPLFFELSDLMQQNKKSLTPLSKNEAFYHLKKIEICKASGMLPTSACPDRELTWFIPGKSPIKRDTIYQEIAIDTKTGLRTCHINKNTRFEIYEFWPSDLLNIFKQAGIQRKIPPASMPDCALNGRPGLSPEISSPQTEISYIVRSNHGPTLIPFTAVTDADIKTLYWFINESYLGKVPAGKPYFWSALPGKFIVRVVDDHGLSEAALIKVQLVS